MSVYCGNTHVLIDLHYTPRGFMQAKHFSVGPHVVLRCEKKNKRHALHAVWKMCLAWTPELQRMHTSTATDATGYDNKLWHRRTSLGFISVSCKYPSREGTCSSAEFGWMKYFTFLRHPLVYGLPQQPVSAAATKQQQHLTVISVNHAHQTNWFLGEDKGRQTWQGFFSRGEYRRSGIKRDPGATFLKAVVSMSSDGISSAVCAGEIKNIDFLFVIAT